MKKTTLLPPHVLTRHAYLCAALGLLCALAFGPHPAKAAVTEAWVHRYSNVVSNSYDLAFKVVRIAAGDVIVTGYTDDGITGQDMLTIKYSGADGSVLWQNRYNGPANSDDRASALAVDGSGNVVVTGYSYNTNGNNDYYTTKYAAVDGALLWEKRGPGGGRAVVVDGSGSVVVTGSGGIGYYTAKYAAADGALLWEKRYNGPVNGNDIATAVAVDGSGDVVVTGYSKNGPPNFDSDYYTAKYAAANGALLWEKRYNSTANSYDKATAVAVDGSGNVVVTGISDAIFDCYDCFWQGDFYTAKYAAADGALLWEKRYNGPANGDDRVAGLALGPNGMVAVTGTSSGDYATVVYRDDAYPISIALVSGGVRLRFTGIPGRSYTIERAPAVTGPWSTLATPTAPPGGLIEYVDTNPPAGTAFYRTSTP